MKPKKFSQIYREAAERLDKYKKYGCCWHINHIEFGNYTGNYVTDAQNYFSKLFYPDENINASEHYYFGSTSNQDCINHRITALLLASEIAKSEGV